MTHPIFLVLRFVIPLLLFLQKNQTAGEIGNVDRPRKVSRKNQRLYEFKIAVNVKQIEFCLRALTSICNHTVFYQKLPVAEESALLKPMVSPFSPYGSSFSSNSTIRSILPLT